MNSLNVSYIPTFLWLLSFSLKSILSFSFLLLLYRFRTSSPFLYIHPSIHQSVHPCFYAFIQHTLKYWYVLVTEHTKVNESWCLLSCCLFLRCGTESSLSEFWSSQPFWILILPAESCLSTSLILSPPLRNIWELFVICGMRRSPFHPRARWYLRAPPCRPQQPQSRLWLFSSHGCGTWGTAGLPSPWACLRFPGSCWSSVLCLLLLNFLPLETHLTSCVLWALTVFGTLSSHILLF